MVSAGMPLRQAAEAIAAQLTAAGCPDAAFDAGDLCLLATGVTVHAVGTEARLTQAQAERLNALAARRANREPLQYLWGQWPFLNFELAVGEGVLCPRADTEIVVEYAAQCCNAQTSVQVLELCGGSGCIGLGIKMFCPHAEVTVLEKSEAALPYLRKNAAHALDGIAADMRASADVSIEASSHIGLMAPYINVVEGDLFAYHTTLPDASFDLLVSNPPYLTEYEMTQLQPEVAREPAMALVAGQDGLDFYRAIARDYRRVVRPGGFLVLEIGCAQAADVMALLTAQGWHEVTCKQDYGKNDRCVMAQR